MACRNANLTVKRKGNGYMDAKMIIYEKAKSNRIALVEVRAQGVEDVSIDIAIQALEVAEKLALELMRKEAKTRETLDALEIVRDEFRKLTQEVRG